MEPSSFGVILVSLITLVWLVYSTIVTSKMPQSLPWAGVRKEVLSKTRANIRELTAGLRTLKMGYNQFNKQGLPYVIPDPGFRPIVMVPQEHLRWISEQPEHMLSLRKAQVGRFAIEYLLPGFDFNHDAFIMRAARKDLTRNLGKMQTAMVEDIRSTIDEAWGLNTESWDEVRIKEGMDAFVFRSTTRAIVGSSLCRNEGYIRYSIGFATWMGVVALLVGQYIPRLLKPFFGYLGAVPVYYRKQKAFKFLLPVIRDRIANIKRKRADPSFDFEEPTDVITWITRAMLDDAETKNNPPEWIGTRILFLVGQPMLVQLGPGKAFKSIRRTTEADTLIQTLGGMHTTIMTANNIWLDLVSSNPNSRFWEQLREEAARVFKTPEDWTNPASLLELPLADSTIRESIRRNPMITRTMTRTVEAKGGVTLPSGHHIPKGTWMAADTVQLHHDDRFYPKPDEYNPFRFANKHETMLVDASTETLTDKASIYRKNEGLTTASDISLGFGFGKHACPGRFLVAYQLKLLLAYITLNYDIQYIPQRPVNIVFGDGLFPPPSAKIKVRRRKHT